MINTADAMLGYRTPELEWFGKTSARIDDVANIAPARLAAILICCTARAGHGSSRNALSVSLRDGRNTPSPNAGWPMAAMAGALGVRLTKRGQYTLNEYGRAPNANDIKRSCKIALASASLAAMLADLT
jgi:adenosylcobinamide-phosphate synthase